MCGAGAADEFDRGESTMTISAQVIDTIVEWIDDNLNQPLRIDDIARHAGYSKWHL
ncbi:transcriptional regulator, partial [Salmonella enterica]